MKEKIITLVIDLFKGRVWDVRTDNEDDRPKIEVIIFNQDFGHIWYRPVHKDPDFVENTRLMADLAHQEGLEALWERDMRDGWEKKMGSILCDKCLKKLFQLRK